jgi:hypothetical protein
MTNPAVIPSFCDLDFTDANGNFLLWRAAHPGEAEPASIGTAKMLADGAIELRLYSTSDGKDAHLLQVLHKSDKLYDEVIRHVGGLKPGETKVVPPWPDDPKPEKAP